MNNKKKTQNQNKGGEKKTKVWLYLFFVPLDL